MGGERGLLELIKGYFTLLEDMQGFKVRTEKQEINNGLEWLRTID